MVENLRLCITRNWAQDVEVGNYSRKVEIGVAAVLSVR
jgi:hypothetical protein